MVRFTVFLFLCMAVSAIYGNPVSQYELPGISEVYWVSPEEWSIELDGSICLYPSECYFPHITGEFSMRCTSSPITYNLNITFESTGYAVITRSSITGVSEDEPVLIGQADTIQIGRDKNGFWSFPLQKVNKGNTQIMSFRFGEPAIFESSRLSLGYEGDYRTKYECFVIDNHDHPLSHIQLCAMEMLNSNGTKQSYNIFERSSSSGLIRFSIGIEQNYGQGFFEDLFSAHSHLERNALRTGAFGYQDSAPSVSRTFIFNTTVYKLVVFDTDGDTISNLQCFRQYCDSMAEPDQCNEGIFYHIADTPEDYYTFKLRVHKEESPTTFYFRRFRDSVTLGSWTGTYVDTSEPLTDTLLIAPVAVARAPAASADRARLRFQVLTAGDGSFFCIVASPLRCAEAFIDLYTISGRKVVSRRLTWDSPGTHALRINSSDVPGGTVPGMYICTLSVGNFRPVSRRVTVH
ncbi:MAG: hypothetical protein JW863_23410 [Chitinispirillaceae bacterium]|nr:hypothetical protein [Chitinispirillaceae bacterium]